MKDASRLKINIGGLALQNPVMTASGTFGYGEEFADILDLNRLGAIIVKGLSLKPSKGNMPPRVAETPSGMLNAIGLENVGIEAFAKEKLPFLRKFSTPVLANIYGKTVDEYAELAARLNDMEGVSGVEVNISCPNVKAGGIVFGVDPVSAYQVVAAVRQRTTLPVVVKLTPNVTDITTIALKVEEAGADAVSLINTLLGMAIDIDTRRPKLANISGGLSGPAIRPIALHMVWQVAQKVSIPVIGIGGIMNAADALEFFIAGATAVQIGTASFVNPRAAIDILEDLETFLKNKEIAHIKDIIGTLKTN